MINISLLLESCLDLQIFKVPRVFPDSTCQRSSHKSILLSANSVEFYPRVIHFSGLNGHHLVLIVSVLFSPPPPPLQRLLWTETPLGKATKLYT